MPQLCNINELKANTDACWNHRGDKFAVGAASGQVYIGTYNKELGLWFALPQDADRALHDGPVVSVKFDPLSSRVVASASADGVVIVSTCYVPEVDSDSKGLYG